MKESPLLAELLAKGPGPYNLRGWAYQIEMEAWVCSARDDLLAACAHLESTEEAS